MAQSYSSNNPIYIGPITVPTPPTPYGKGNKYQSRNMPTVWASHNPSILPVKPFGASSTRAVPFGRIKTLYDRNKGRKYPLLKKWGLTLKQLKVDPEVFKKFMSNWQYYNDRERIPKGWRSKLPFLYCFTSMTAGKQNQIKIKMRSYIIDQQVVSGLIYIKTYPRPIYRYEAFDHLGHLKPGLDWDRIRKDKKCERFLVDMTTCECYKILWSKDENSIFKRLLNARNPLTIQGLNGTLSTEESPTVKKEVPYDYCI